MTSPSPPITRRLVLAVLASRPVRALRRWVRDMAWSRKGLHLRNPTLAGPVRSMLFICKGNICRSPFADLLTRRLAAELGVRGLRVGSAGLAASVNEPCPADAVAAGREWGVDLTIHTPAQLTTTLAREHELLIVMEPWQAEVLEQWPEARGKVWLLSLLDPSAVGAFERYNIADPFGRPREEFDACYARIDRCVRTLLARVASLDGPLT